MAEDQNVGPSGVFRRFQRATGDTDFLQYASAHNPRDGGGGPIFGRPDGESEVAEGDHVAHVARAVEPEAFVFRPPRPLPGQDD